MNTISKKLAVAAAAVLSLTAMTAEAGPRDGYRYRAPDHRPAPVAKHHYRNHAHHGPRHRHARAHGHWRGHRHGHRHAHYGPPPHPHAYRRVVYAPVYPDGPRYGRGATIWIDGVGFSIYDSR